MQGESNDWSIEIDETSAGVYLLRAEGRAGRSVELRGIDAEQLRSEASELITQLERAE